MTTKTQPDEHLAITEDWPAFFLSRHIARTGADAIRGHEARLAAIPADAPIRIQAKELIAKELENWGLDFLLARRDRAAMDEAQAMMRASQREDQVKAVQAEWKRSDVKSVEGLIDFVGRHLGGLITVDEQGRSLGAGGNALIGLIKSGTRTGIACDPRSLIVCVRTPEAAKFEKLHKLPKTLSWESDGWSCWAFDGGSKLIRCTIGDNVKLCSHMPSTAGSYAYAPATSPKWIVGPEKALDDATGKLPAMPEGLAAVVEGISGSTGSVVDRLLL